MYYISHISLSVTGTADIFPRCRSEKQNKCSPHCSYPRDINHVANTLADFWGEGRVDYLVNPPVVTYADAMFGGYTEVAAYYVEQDPAPPGGYVEQGPLPVDYIPPSVTPDPWHRAATCQQDFILIAEFSEQEGPKPLVNFASLIMMYRTPFSCLQPL